MFMTANLLYPNNAQFQDFFTNFFLIVNRGIWEVETADMFQTIHHSCCVIWTLLRHSVWGKVSSGDTWVCKKKKKKLTTKRKKTAKEEWLREEERGVRSVCGTLWFGPVVFIAWSRGKLPHRRYSFPLLHLSLNPPRFTPTSPGLRPPSSFFFSSNSDKDESPPLRL